MKGICLFIVLLFPLFAHGQLRETAFSQPDIHLLRLHYQNSSGEEGVSVFDFDEKGHITKGLWYLLNGKRNSVNFYDVDKNGRVIEKFRIFSDGFTSTTFYVYDAQNHITEEIFSRSDGVKGSAQFFYNETGALEKSVFNNTQGWLSGTVIYAYGKKGHCTKADIYQKEQKVGEIEYTYNEDDLLEREHWDFNGRWSQTFLYEYDDYSRSEPFSFTPSNPFLSESPLYKLSQEKYTYSDEFNGCSYFEYDKSRLVRKIYYSQGKSVVTVTHLYYDGNRKLINALRRYADGRSAVFIYSYNDKRKITEKKALFTNGDMILENYAYNENGRLAEAQLTNFDSWINGTITFQHNEKGRITLGKFQGRDDVRADIDFSYHDNGMLSKIIWHFNSGDFQQYLFGYCAVDETLTMEKPETKILNQNCPDDEARLFAPGIVSDGLDNRDIAMTPDGKELYFCVSNKGFEFATILYVRLLDDIWTKPEVVPFAQDPRYIYFEPCISHDGSRMLFLSNMPKDPASADPADEDIWCVDRTGNGWGKPYNLGPPVNSPDQEYFPSLTRDNTLYFTRSVRGEPGSMIYRSRFINGKYTEPEKLPEQVNCGQDRFNAFAAADESFVIVPAVIPEKAIGGCDYYVVFRNADDTWNEPVNLGDKINSKTGQEWSPYITPDGRNFFFMASRHLAGEERPEKLSYAFLQRLHKQPENGGSDIYWIRADFIKKLRWEK